MKKEYIFSASAFRMHTNGRRAPFSAAGFNSFSPFAFRLVLGCRGARRRKKKEKKSRSSSSYSSYCTTTTVAANPIGQREPMIIITVLPWTLNTNVWCEAKDSLCIDANKLKTISFLSLSLSLPNITRFSLVYQETYL